MIHDVIGRVRARLIRLLTAMALLATALWCAGTARADSADTQYYLSLGDSLAQGFQPIGGPPGSDTADPGYAHGYADQLFKTVRGATPGSLRLVALGCGGETTATMRVAHPECPYDAGSQLEQAVHFLTANSNKVAFITIDLGANDFFKCSAQFTDFEMVKACTIQSVSTNLPVILTTLRTAAPGVPIIGMTYYSPLTAVWFQHQQAAMDIANATDLLNTLLKTIYTKFQIPVADVGATFAITDFTTMKDLPGVGSVPLAVYNTCTFTWNCTPPPLGPNIHPNTDGYALIAQTFIPIVSTVWPR
jgi:lysophospholipase L1-like esterase